MAVLLCEIKGTFGIQKKQPQQKSEKLKKKHGIRMVKPQQTLNPWATASNAHSSSSPDWIPSSKLRSQIVSFDIDWRKQMTV